MSPRSLGLATLTGLVLVALLAVAVSAADARRPSEREPRALHHLIAHHIERVTRVSEHIHTVTPALREAQELLRMSLQGREMSEQEMAQVDEAMEAMTGLQSQMVAVTQELEASLTAWSAAMETEGVALEDLTSTTKE